MKVDVQMPQLGESITEATIIKWHKRQGDAVKKDELLLDISTEKVDTEVPAPASGRVAELLFAEGQTVPVRATIARIEAAGAAEEAPASGTAPRAESEQPGQQQEQAAKPLSPLAKTVAEKQGISPVELSGIPGTGKGGRVTKQDVLNHLAGKTKETAGTDRRASPAGPPPAAAGSQSPAGDEWGPDETRIEMMDHIREAIAQHMVRSKATSPHVYTMQEVDMSLVARWRAAHKDLFQEHEGFSLSFTPFFLEAAVKALLQFPYVNASVDGKKIILHKHVHLGCAVALGTSGLIVPVIRRAEEKNLVGLARSLNELAAKARNRKLLPDEVLGGTFTVTNPGSYGTVIGTPIINQPQVAILCIGAIKKRPVVIEDMIAIRQICYLTLSYDHRLIDGALAAQFLAYICDYLQSWNMEQSLY